MGDGASFSRWEGIPEGRGSEDSGDNEFLEHKRLLVTT